MRDKDSQTGRQTGSTSGKLAGLERGVEYELGGRGGGEEEARPGKW